jgi:hypothetical protein
LGEETSKEGSPTGGSKDGAAELEAREVAAEVQKAWHGGAVVPVWSGEGETFKSRRTHRAGGATPQRHARRVNGVQRDIAAHPCLPCLPPTCMRAC